LVDRFFSCRSATAFAAYSLRSKITFIKFKLAEFLLMFFLCLRKYPLANLLTVGIDSVATHANDDRRRHRRNLFAKTLQYPSRFLMT
jgi:hypothetical protein